jgi:hypothetical protein
LYVEEGGQLPPPDGPEPFNADGWPMLVNWDY